MSEDQLFKIRHSLSHILAMAVLEVFPDAKLAIGPPIDTGFYYDFDLPRGITPEDLKDLQQRMERLVKQKISFEKTTHTVKEALDYFKDQPYKVELIKDLATAGETEVGFYQSGSFTDLCKGPHVQSTSEIPQAAFCLSHAAGAYWRGDEKRPMLQRIYGLAFASKEALKEYQHMLEEAKKRDHRVLGPQLDLFFFHETSPGMPYWLPKGVVLYNELVNFWREEHQKRGYQEIISPLLNKKELYQTSGHWDHYHEHMFISETSDGETYGMKPMNCPNAMVVFGMKAHSYRELPLRLSDTDALHRFELSGALNGLLRVREFRQDDAHIFITPEQIKEEYGRIFEIVERFYSIFGMQYTFRLGTRPEKFMGDPKIWDRAERELTEIMETSGRSYFVLEGDGAFYGPKIDILMKDSLGREWQMGTIQLDFQLPLNFQLSYIDTEGNKQTPVTIHRVVYGSLERFIGILTEHYAGAFPFWIAPVQVAILAVSDQYNSAVEEIAQLLRAQGIRSEVDLSTESVGKKIRNASLQKIPAKLVIGGQEVDEYEKSKEWKLKVNWRADLGEESKEALPLSEILKDMQQRLAQKA